MAVEAFNKNNVRDIYIFLPAIIIPPRHPQI